MMFSKPLGFPEDVTVQTGHDVCPPDRQVHLESINISGQKAKAAGCFWAIIIYITSDAQGWQHTKL